MQSKTNKKIIVSALFRRIHKLKNKKRKEKELIMKNKRKSVNKKKYKDMQKKQ